MNCPSKLRASIGKQLRVLYIHTSSAPPPLAITLINEGRLVICPSALKFCLFWLTPQKSGALTPTLSPTKQKKKKRKRLAYKTDSRTNTPAVSQSFKQTCIHVDIHTLNSCTRSGGQLSLGADAGSFLAVAAVPKFSVFRDLQFGGVGGGDAVARLHVVALL